MASYQLLYWDQRKELLKKPSLIWASLVAPLLLLGTFAYGFLWGGPQVFSFIVQFMYIAVGWHYVKQVFGMMVVPSIREGFYFSKLERWTALANLYSVWALSFAYGQYQAREADFYGVRYALYGVSDFIMSTIYSFVVITLVGFLTLMIRRWLKEGKTFHHLGWLAFLSLYAWYIPLAQHPHFFYMIPFFHSLQYLIFVIALKKNQWGQCQAVESEHENRKWWLKRATMYFGAALLLGVLSFLWLPEFLDSIYREWSPTKSEILGGTIFMASFHLFINIHHYFIDNVIWKRGNPQMKYLA